MFYYGLSAEKRFNKKPNLQNHRNILNVADLGNSLGMLYCRLSVKKEFNKKPNLQNQ
jgi:hypothetical protein